MVCADYNGKCLAGAEVVCSMCGQGFCWDHLLTLRLARGTAIVEERYVCRNCTEQLVDEIEEERIGLKRAIQILEQDVAACKKQLQKEVKDLSEEHAHGLYEGVDTDA